MNEGDRKSDLDPCAAVPRAWRILIVLAAIVHSMGCHDIGRGGTGERVVPRATLREIDAVDPSRYVTTAPSTAPSTLPSTRAAPRPLAQRPLSIEEVRQLALANNLEIAVTLISPAIARESLNAEEARYEAIFTTNANFSDNDTPTATLLEGSQTQGLSIRPGMQFPLRTGGLIDV